MKMNSAQIEQTLQQFQAQAIPAGHPVTPKLERLFGDHTYFPRRQGPQYRGAHERRAGWRPAGSGGESRQLGR
jgi:hypothetical protein